MTTTKQTDDRLVLLQQWLEKELGMTNYEIAPASADASFRRYFRISWDGESRVVMDAPPDKENTGPFIGISSQLDKLGLHVPVVLEQESKQGFLLLTDLGHQDYLSSLNDQTVSNLYSAALSALLKLQSCPVPADYPFPPYDRTLLMNEMGLFRDWYLGRHLGMNMSSDCQAMLSEVFDVLADSALAQPQVVVHRDYHSRNLMLSEPNPGVLDFQDAVIGSVTYDLVSLLRDCYIAWPRKQVEKWVSQYYASLVKNEMISGIDEAQFLHWFDLMGVQRHLKATGIFARLNYRDGKEGYLKDIPRTMGYVKQVAQGYPALEKFAEFIDQLEANGEQYLDIPQ
ncbi:MAG: phosphotransferase [Gammaproteobacteria bacterium]|nr:phosphotransferase [Gammaproteobacteria bacterium]